MNVSNAGEGAILAIDDDSSTRRALRVTLPGLGYTVTEAARGEEALSLVRARWFDAVPMDADMPGMGGVEACKSIRRVSARLPILMLSVLDSEDDVVMALDAGADDYITKPFRLRTLTARLRSAVRRRNAPETSQDTPIRYGQLELDPVMYRVRKNGRAIHLSPKGFEMLDYLMDRAGEPIPHERLLRAVWGQEYSSELEYLRTYMHRLRKKIEDDPMNPQYLLTEARVGYRFNDRQPRC